MIVNVLRSIKVAMAEPALQLRKALRASARTGPTMAELRARVRLALRDPDDGVDHGSLSRAERDEALAKRFGI